MALYLLKKKNNPRDVITLSEDANEGFPAPDFVLRNEDGNEVALHDFLGQPVILAFYPADWSPVCGSQLTLYNEVLDMFEEHDAQLLGISVDSHWSHRAYAEERNLRFPLLADFEPKGDISRLYGVYNEDKGFSERALFVIDRDGIVRWRYVSPTDVNPGAHGILNALSNLG